MNSINTMTSSKYSLHKFDIDEYSVIFKNTSDRNKYLLRKTTSIIIA